MHMVLCGAFSQICLAPVVTTFINLPVLHIALQSSALSCFGHQISAERFCCTQKVGA